VNHVLGIMHHELAVSAVAIRKYFRRKKEEKTIKKLIKKNIVYRKQFLEQKLNNESTINYEYNRTPNTTCRPKEIKSSRFNI